MFKSTAATLVGFVATNGFAQEDHSEVLERKIVGAFTTFAKDDTVIYTSEWETGRPVTHEEESPDLRK